MKTMPSINFFGSLTRSVLAKFTLALLLIWPGGLLSKPRPTQPPWPSQGRLCREGFDQPYHLSSDQTIDPSTWTESWSGWALNRTGQNPKVAPWRVPILTPKGSWNLDPQRGALQLWYRPEYNSGNGPGSLARLLTLVSEREHLSAAWWSLVVSADGTCLHLLCETAKGSESCASAVVGFQAGNWYLLTLGYTETNTALFVDDRQVAEGNGLLTVPEEAAPFTSLVIGSGISGDVAAGQIDEFAAFTGRSRFHQEALAPFGIDPIWEIQGCWARLNRVTRLGPVTPEEEAATREQASAQRAALLVARQAAAENLAASASMMMLDGGERYLPLYGGTNGFWLSPPVFDGTNVSLTMFNTETNKSYNILFSSLLVTNPWSVIAATGALAQTSFTVPLFSGGGFFQAAEGNDWDGDGILNWMDANPSSTNVGTLTITIESPTNNSVIP